MEGYTTLPIYLELKPHKYSLVSYPEHLTSQLILGLANRVGGYPRGVMVKVMSCGIVASEFVLQSRYYVHFRAILWERNEPPYPPSYGLNNIPTVLLGEWVWH